MKIIYGPKGSGKTTQIIEEANNALEKAKGYVVFITDTKRCSFNLKYQIRFLDTTDVEIANADGLRGFIKGIVASSGDNEYIFIDGIARIAGKPVSELEDLFVAMEKLEANYGVKFVLTVSGNKEELPEFVLKSVN